MDIKDIDRTLKEYGATWRRYRRAEVLVEMMHLGFMGEELFHEMRAFDSEMNDILTARRMDRRSRHVQV